MRALSGNQRLSVVLFLLMFAERVTAKGSTVRLVITGPPLAQPVEVVEPAALANVWNGSFMREPSSEPDSRVPRYLITFHVQPPCEQPRAMYVVRYVRDPESGDGFIDLPGRSEDGWSMNVRTILRDGQDGQWHRANREWSDALARALVR